MGSETSSPPLNEDDYETVHGLRNNRLEFGGKESLFLDEKFSNVELYVEVSSKIKWRFPCHYHVLCQASTVFEQQIDNLPKSETKCLTIYHTKPEIMEIVLIYIYHNNVDLYDWQTACDVHRVAKRYKINPLMKECESYLKKSLTLRNVCYILELSKTCESGKLKEHCLSICENAGFVILCTNAFSHVSKSTVELIVSLKNLNVMHELSVFKALWTWAKMECVRRQCPLYEEKILTEFSQFAKYVGFEFFDEKMKNFLPIRIQEIYNFRLGTAKNNVRSDESYLSEARHLKFPLKIDYFNTIRFEMPKSSYAEGSFIECIRFSVNIGVYLMGFTVICKEHTSLKGSTKAESYIESIELISPTKSSDVWKNTVSKQHFFEVSKVAICCTSASDETKVIEIQFNAIRLIPLQEGSEYTLQIQAVKTAKQPFFEWPLVCGIDDNERSDIEFCLRSKVCRGMRKIKLLQAN